MIKCVLQLLADASVNRKMSWTKSSSPNWSGAGIAYTVRRIDTMAVIEVGRFCYRLNEQGQSIGGWISNLAADRKAEWERWAALLIEDLS